MASTDISAQKILERGIEILRESLPTSWVVQWAAENDAGMTPTDTILNVTSQQAALRIVVEIRRDIASKDVVPLARQARLLARVAGNTPVLVIAPWISDRVRQALTEAGINYVDLAGNARIATEYPPLFILRDTKTPGPKRRQSTPSLKGLKASRVARLLVDVCPPYGVVALARHSGVTPGYASRLLDALEREDLIERAARGGVADVRWRELLIRRTETYGLFTSNQVDRYVCPNGPAYAMELARDQPANRNQLALTGSFAAEQIVSSSPPVLLVLYAVTRPSALISGAALLPAEAGANVVIASPFDSEVLLPRWPPMTSIRSNVNLVGASQLALDCLTGSGRMPQEGEALLDWMAEDESRWRFRSLAELAVQAATA